MMQADIIIVGAGAAGLIGAKTLSETGKKIIVLEARDRIGGRIHTITDAAFLHPVETGAEFIHGNLELTLQLLKEAGIKTLPSGGEVWRSNEGRLFQQEDFIEDGDALMQALEKQKTESSVADFLASHFSDARYADLKKSVQGYIEGYYAGDLKKASLLTLKEEWLKEEEPQHRVQGGYSKLMQALYDECIKNGVQFFFSAPVKSIAWAFQKVDVTTANGQFLTAQKIITTIPSSLFQKENVEAAIRFQPEIPEQMAAFKKLGHGNVIKILMEFKNVFWKETFHLTALSFLFSEEPVPTWWTQHPQQSPLLTGWCAGPHADALKGKSEAELFQISMQSLTHIFNLPALEIKKNITGWKICNWAADPFTHGGYSYVTTTTEEALQVLAQPVENTIYFAGEALYDNINAGTVEAALQSGKQVAEKLLTSLAYKNAENI